MSILFKGDNKALISSINALLALDAKGALSPHGLGEMARDLLETCAARMPAEQHQGEPVAWLAKTLKGSLAGTLGLARYDQRLNPELYDGPFPVFRHADPGEVERLRTALKFYADREHYHFESGHWDTVSGEPLNILWRSDEPDFIEDGTVARSALSASAEPSTPVEIDEPTDLATWKRRTIEAESKLRTYDPQVVELGAQAMQALLAEPKPSELVLTKCKLCDQLQADLTDRDEQNDQVRQLLQHMISDYRHAMYSGYDQITALGGDCDSVAKMLDDNPNYQKALALVLPDLKSRPEERGTPETEPCSGCGTPGWTGACNKCVPY